MRLRTFCNDGATAARGLATDEVLAERAGDGTSPPTLRLYTYRPHCVLVGRFQDVACEVDLERCADEGLDVNRRPTGGGAILMGPDQLGVALSLPKQHGRPRDVMSGFSAGVVTGLAALGIDARFRGKNDLAVDGRKIAGLGLHRTASGGFLFHASVLVDMDTDLMTTVLRTPFKQIGERERGIVRRRITAIREHTGRPVPMEEVRGAVAEAFDGRDCGPLTDAERHAIATRERNRYRDPAWVHQASDIPDTVGRAAVRTDGGTVDVRVAMAGRTIKAAWVRGDFFADERVVSEIEGRLRWHPGDRESVAATISAAWSEGAETDTVGEGALVDAVNAAVSRAAAEAGEPYGCFVAPEPCHD